MCGPSPQEEMLANQEASLSTTMKNAFNDRFATQTDILGQVQTALGQLQSGNFPPGYSPSIMAGLRTDALNQVAGATQSARQAAGNAVAGQGGGAGSALVSGPQQQIQAQIASTGAKQQADLLNQLNIKSFDLGRENLISSISGLNTLAGEEAPLQYGQQAITSTGQAFDQAKTINQQKNQMWSDIAGGITGIAKAGLGVLSGGASNLISSPFGSSGGFPGTPTAGSLSPTDSEINGDLIAP
jgi:hypothetical protein